MLTVALFTGSWPFVAFVACLASACLRSEGPARFPTGAGTPFPEFAGRVSAGDCGLQRRQDDHRVDGDVGQGGTTKLRGRIDAGFAAPGRARLEGHPPFGKPVFILVADGGRGTLVLPREDRVLRDAPPDQIVEALAGVPLGPDALRTAISGCGFGAARPAEGRRSPTAGSAASLGDGDHVSAAERAARGKSPPRRAAP